MDSFLRLLQIALIITQIYQSQQQTTNTSSSISLSTNTSSSISLSTNTSSSISLPTNTSSSISLPTNTSLSISLPTNTSSSISLPTNTSSSSSLPTNSTKQETATPVPPVNTSTGENKVTSTVRTPPATTTQLSPSGNPSTTGERTVKQTVSTVPDVTPASQTSGVPVTLTELVSQTASAVPAKSTQSTLQTSNVSVMSNESVSPTRNVSVASTEPASNGSTASESTNATSVSHSGSISHYMTAKYSSSSASKPGSVAVTTFSTRTRASSTVQSLTPSPVSLNWTDWSVDSGDCEKYCSEKGGTVTASRQCKSHSSTLENSVCTIHNISTTKVVKCDEPYCPISGTEAFRGSISTIAVGISLIRLSTLV